MLERIEKVAAPLEAAGLYISRSDRFVIGAAQLLIDAGPEVLSYEDVRDRLEELRSKV